MIALTLLLMTAAPPVEIVKFASPEGAVRLEKAKAKSDFFALAGHYEAQVNGGMCGPASSVIVLNALRVDNPTAPAKPPRDTSTVPPEVLARMPKGVEAGLARYTQTALIADAKFATVKPLDQFYGKPKDAKSKPSPGLQLRELAGVLGANGLAVDVRVVDAAAKDDAIIKELSENVGRSGDFVIVNYLRTVVGQAGGGHHSPVGAYDEASKSFLILDTNPTEGKGWAWVPASALVAAMRTPDVGENRGYLIVKEGAAK
jgi:hypothetical protein